MITKITISQCQLLKTPKGKSFLFIEASSAGLQPLEWPELIVIRYPNTEEEESYIREKANIVNGELEGYSYSSKKQNLYIAND